MSIEMQANGKLLVDPRYYDITPKEATSYGYDRKYIDQFNRLNCAEDLRKLYSWNNKQITQVMALWAAFKKQFRHCLKVVLKDSSIVVTNNKRMLAFLQHMTYDKDDIQENHSWKVYLAEHLPTELSEIVDYFFLINPTKTQSENLTLKNEDGYLFVLGANASHLYVKYTISDSIDNAVCGPIKDVFVGI